MSEKREYHSQRTGRSIKPKLTLDEFKGIVRSIFQEFLNKGYFGHALGYQDSRGTIYGDICAHYDDDCINQFIFRKLRKRNLWPIIEKIAEYSEDDLFDIIELFYDIIAKPRPHKKTKDILNYIGLPSPFTEIPEYLSFNVEEGKNEFRFEVNNALHDYQEGYELSENGEIQLIGEKDLQSLFSEEVSPTGNEAIDKKIEAAIIKFRHHRSSDDQKREAVRELADVLEFLRPEMKKLHISSDESEIFNIANNFGIRHFNPGQKTDYDNPIFLTWIFSCYLSTIYLIIRLLNQKNH
jgi:hypothetical protein